MNNYKNIAEEIILKEPLEVGTTWSADGGPLNRKITSINTDIETPSGSYNAELVIPLSPKMQAKIKNMGIEIYK